MSKQNIIETTGIVKEIINQTTFNVQLKNTTMIIATISSLVKLDFDIYLGEEVPIEMSPFDKTRGRINTRYWKQKRRLPN